MSRNGMKNSGEQIQNYWRALQSQWNDTSSQWNDEARHSFEKEFWQEFDTIVPSVIDEMAKLADVLDRAQRRVKPPPPRRRKE